MKKTKKIALIILLVIAILFIVNIVRNYIILNKLQEKISNLISIEKYSVTIKSKNEETTVTKNNNIIKIVKNSSDVIKYFNTDTNELIEEKIYNGEKNLYTDRKASFNLNLLDTKNHSLLFNLILITNVNGEKCYKIKDNSLDDTIFYINISTGLTMKVVNEKNNEIVDYLNYEFDNIEELKFET